MERFMSASFGPIAMAMAITLSLGCGEETSGETQYSGVVVKAEFSDLPNCRKQATSVIYYVSSTEDFWYCDSVTLEYIRLDNLDWPLDGVVEVAQATTGNCPAGGTTINAGPDADGDGIIDEVTSTETVCNGVDGIGSVVETETILASGVPPCPGGGIIINVGPDTDADGLIDGEPTSVETICHGVGWIVETETLPPSGGPPCPTGGVAISAGPDADRDGQIDDEPPPFSDTVCSGSGCTVADNENGTYNITCGDSTVTVSDPACTVDDNGDGTATVRCNDGTYTTVTDLQECGDGVVHYGEECDDGNLQERDGCSPLCVIEFSTCGDGVLEWDEECDDGNTVDGDDCSASCLLEFCGDGTVNNSGTEGCDDGNTVDGDGCSASCVPEVCGNGVVTSGNNEECDDGNTVDGDGCDSNCQWELLCGDGFAVPGEECDDGNIVSGDGCSADCRYEFRLAYSSYYDDELFTNIPNGTEQQFVASIVYGSFAWDWSPDGTRIAYRARQATTEPPSGDCSLVPAIYIGDGDCDCPSNGSTACDLDDCPDGNNGSAYCGCDYCYPDPLPTTYGPRELFTNTPDGSDPLQVNAGIVGSYGVWKWAWSPDGTRIAYIADQDADGTDELYTSAFNGADNFKVNGLLVAGGNVTQFAWSPDGARLAYMADQYTDGVPELYAAPWDGSANYEINDPLAAGGVIREFAWSPDGDLIAYRADQDTYYMEELYTSSWDGFTKHKVSAPLQSGGWVRLFGWSPTGDTIAYLAYPVWPGDAYLYTSASDGSENYLIEAGVVGGIDDWGWSPDGTRLGYLAPTGTGPDGLFTNNPTGTDRIRVSPAGGDVWELAWSPDGTRIAYIADQDTDGMDELYTSAWDGTGNYQISVPVDPDGRGVTGFAWSPDGSRVAYTADADWLYLELFSSTWDGSEKDKVSSDRATSFFAWSPSGGFIAYLSYSDVLYSSASDGSNHQQVSALATDKVDEFAWSPAPNR